MNGAIRKSRSRLLTPPRNKAFLVKRTASSLNKELTESQGSSKQVDAVGRLLKWQNRISPIRYIEDITWPNFIFEW